MKEQSGLMPKQSKSSTPKPEHPRVNVDWLQWPNLFLERRVRHKRRKYIPPVPKQDEAGVLKRIKEIKDSI